MMQPPSDDGGELTVEVHNCCYGFVSVGGTNYTLFTDDKKPGRERSLLTLRSQATGHTAWEKEEFGRTG